MNEKAISELGSPPLADSLAGLNVPARLELLCKRVTGRKVFTTSFGLEDQILTHFICESKLDVEFATLDTGRLFDETYKVWSATELKYQIKIRPYFPDADSVEKLVQNQGINGFYDGLEQRKACCYIRKVAPLARALAEVNLWLTGLRAAQSEERAGLDILVHDNDRALFKANPIADWSDEDVEVFLTNHPDVPLNELHNKGFPSIGCAPCTRAVKPGQSTRAGRWWWEQSAGVQECGLHIGPDGRLLRTKRGRA